MIVPTKIKTSCLSQTEQLFVNGWGQYHEGDGNRWWRHSLSNETGSSHGGGHLAAAFGVVKHPAGIRSVDKPVGGQLTEGAVQLGPKTGPARYCQSKPFASQTGVHDHPQVARVAARDVVSDGSRKDERVPATAGRWPYAVDSFLVRRRKRRRSGTAHARIQHPV